MSSATYTYKLNAHSGYQSKMTGSITPHRHGVVCAVLAGLVTDDVGIAKEAGNLLAVLEKSIVDLAKLFFELETGRQPADAERSKIIELAKPGTLLGDMVAATKKARGEE